MSSTRPSAAAPDGSTSGSTAPAIPLTALVEVVGGELVGPAAGQTTAVDDVTHDSRAVRSGVLFACRPGALADGHDFAPDAVARGAAALLVERPLDLTVPQLRVDSVARRLGPVAATVHGDPSARLDVIGVTGTNGKTTCATLLEGVLAAAGARTGLIGTVATRIAGRDVPGVRTTPEATDLQRLFRHMYARQVTAVAMEVSSHGLALGRVNGTRFALVLFTNLTRDHLDFHGTMQAYYRAKAQLFTPEFAHRGVVDVDDRWGRRLAREAGIAVTTVSARADADADVVVTQISPAAEGSTITVRMHDAAHELQIGLPGRFNVSNAVLVLTAAQHLGVELETVAAALRMPWAVPGRMERIDEGQPFTVLVDYAHTPDSLTRVLEATRELVDGRVLLTVGCGGERDRGKRPAMGAAAVTGADHVVFTSDNPRGEDPHAILAAIVEGARTASGGRWSVEVDRRAAIASVLATARPGDAVVIAGKGHEVGQQLAEETIDFDDRVVARDLLRARNRA
ncbi:MAG: UDP-N-acetylmuramoyl-L-alanyl-D-glutamate--2,6-diaminopimelate ligase [Actinobacteria bacterium]|nr:UDP-N-acetylmuramoyl-L-alanyl-D-glutamate--2,6-diaminopimelate ligase [Actinomycetota bacterium]